MQEGRIQIGTYSFNFKDRLLTHDGITTPLTKKESALLKVLAGNMNSLTSRETAIHEVWGDEGSYYHNGRSMDVYIVRLKKLLKADSNVAIVNSHGFGFSLIVNSSTSV